MGDHYYGRGDGEVLLIPKTDLPDNARLLTDNEVMTIQTERVKRIKPTWESTFYEYGGYIGMATTALSGLMLEMAVRKNCRLGGLQNVMTKAAVCIMPALMTTVMHDNLIKKTIILGRQDCVWCAAAKSGVLQCAHGVLYTYSIAMLCCIPVAQKYWTFPQPKNESIFKLVHKLSPPRRTVLPLIGINMVVGGAMAILDVEFFNRYLAKPPAAEDMKCLQKAEEAAQ